MLAILCRLPEFVDLLDCLPDSDDHGRPLDAVVAGIKKFAASLATGTEDYADARPLAKEMERKKLVVSPNKPQVPETVLVKLLHHLEGAHRQALPSPISVEHHTRHSVYDLLKGGVDGD